jgi:hypothetical protein
MVVLGSPLPPGRGNLYVVLWPLSNNEALRYPLRGATSDHGRNGRTGVEPALRPALTAFTIIHLCRPAPVTNTADYLPYREQGPAYPSHGGARPLRHVFHRTSLRVRLAQCPFYMGWACCSMALPSKLTGLLVCGLRRGLACRGLADPV